MEEQCPCPVANLNMEGDGLERVPIQKMGRSFKKTVQDKRDEKQKKLSYIVDSYKTQLDVLEKCKDVKLTSMSINQFFNSDVTYDFGVGATIQCRVGIEPGRNKYMLYLRRENGSYKPTLLKILYSDLPSICLFLKRVLSEIGLANLPWEMDEHQPTEPEFWKNSTSVLYSASGEFRVKVQVTRSGLIFLHFNRPAEQTEIENWYGPRIKLMVEEVEQFLEIVDEIKQLLPPLDIMEDFMD